MTFTPSFHLPLVLVSLLSLSASAAPVLTELGSGTDVAGISGDGTTICGSVGNNAFSWTASGGQVLLPGPDGGAGGKGLAASGSGSVIVGSLSGGATLVALRWFNGQVSVMTTLPGSPSPVIAKQSTASGVSANGNVIVGFSTSSTRIQEAFRQEGGVTLGLGVLPGGTGTSRANAVSADGITVVGQSSSSSGNEAFVQLKGQAMTGLGDFPGGSFTSTANAVSADGSVVVGTGAIAVANLPQSLAFRWSRTSGLTPLANPAASINGQALAISGDAKIITGTAILGGVPNAVVWTTAGGAQSLATVLASKGVNMTGLTLLNASAISADGDVIAGDGVRNGQAEGWVLHGALEALGLVTVIPLPKLAISRTSTTALLHFDAQPGYRYQIEKSPDLSAGSWSGLGTEYSPSASGAHEVTDGAAVDGEAFYRLRVEAAP